MDIRSEKYLKVKPMITAAAWDLSRKYTYLTFDDALGECNLQFAKHMDKHDPAKGALTTFTGLIMWATRRNEQDKFCKRYGLPRYRRINNKRTGWDTKPINNGPTGMIEDCVGSKFDHPIFLDMYECVPIEHIGYFDPTDAVFAESRNWEAEEQALLDALYTGTEQGIEATAASVARNFPTWGKSRAQQRLTSLRAKVFEVIKC